MPPQRVGFLGRFGLKTGMDFDHFSLESGVVFEGITGVYERIYRFSSKWIRKKEKNGIRSGFEEIFFYNCSNLINADIISWRPGLKIGVKSGIFWSEIGSGFGKPGYTPSNREYLSSWIICLNSHTRNPLCSRSFWGLRNMRPRVLMIKLS